MQEVLQQQLRLYTTGTCGGRAWGQSSRVTVAAAWLKCHSCRCRETGWAFWREGFWAGHGAAMCL